MLLFYVLRLNVVCVYLAYVMVSWVMVKWVW